MIHFETVKWKNFLSTGNNFTEIQLDRNSTTLIIGENGSGKSTILREIANHHLEEGRSVGMLMLEEAPEEYIQKLVLVCREVRNNLTEDGTLWLNISDSYYNYRPGKGQSLVLLHVYLQRKLIWGWMFLLFNRFIVTFTIFLCHFYNNTSGKNCKAEYLIFMIFYSIIL